MSEMVEPLGRLINELSKLPGIGRRSAARIAYYLLDRPKPEVRTLAEAIWRARADIHICSVCQGFSEEEVCPICGDPRRDPTMICVVSEPRDVAVMERTGEFHGTYHVLHGTLSPGENRGPDDIRLKELVTRIADGKVKEVIVATSPNLEGEATAMYIARLLAPFGVLVTRIARGVPVGTDLEYADEVTLGKALLGRREIG